MMMLKYPTIIFFSRGRVHTVDSKNTVVMYSDLFAKTFLSDECQIWYR